MEMNPLGLGPGGLLRGAIGRLRRVIFRSQLRRCGVLVEYDSDHASESMKIGCEVVAPPQAKHYLPSLKKWATRLAAGRFQLIVDQGASRLLLQREAKVVALSPIRTLVDFLGGVIKHWDSIEVGQAHDVRSIAGVTVAGQVARVNYRGIWLEYEVATNWAEESLEEVLFWGDLLPNYYYQVGPPIHNGLVFDLGAYHGLFGLAAAIDAGPGGRVFCFEPDAQSRGALEANCRRNNLTAIEVIPAGVAGRTEKRSFASLGGLGSHFFGEGVAATEDGVQVYSLPDCCKLLGIGAPAFVKADIEGAEVEMVETALEWIQGLPDTAFAMASYHIVDEEATKLRLERAFRKAKYHVATTREGHQTTVAWRA